MTRPGTIVVLGGTGYVGSAVCHLLRRTGPVTSVSRRAAGPHEDHVVADLSDPAQVRAVVTDAATVVCAMGYRTAGTQWRVTGFDAAARQVNVDAVVEVVRALGARSSSSDGARPLVVLAGTMAVHVDDAERGYAAQKREVERALASAAAEGRVRGVSLQLSTVYGARTCADDEADTRADDGGRTRRDDGADTRADDGGRTRRDDGADTRADDGLRTCADDDASPAAAPLASLASAPLVGSGVVAAWARAALRGEPLRVWGDGAVRRDLVHVDDVARAFERVVRGPDGLRPAYELGSGVGRPLRWIAEQVALAAERHTGRRSAVESLPAPEHAAPSDLRDVVADPSPFTADTGWTPRADAERAIADVVDRLARAAEPTTDLKERA